MELLADWAITRLPDVSQTSRYTPSDELWAGPTMAIDHPPATKLFGSAACTATARTLCRGRNVLALTRATPACRTPVRASAKRWRADAEPCALQCVVHCPRSCTVPSSRAACTCCPYTGGKPLIAASPRPALTIVSASHNAYVSPRASGGAVCTVSHTRPLRAWKGYSTGPTRTLLTTLCPAKAAAAALTSLAWAGVPPVTVMS